MEQLLFMEIQQKSKENVLLEYLFIYFKISNQSENEKLTPFFKQGHSSKRMKSETYSELTVFYEIKVS